MKLEMLFQLIRHTFDRLEYFLNTHLFVFQLTDSEKKILRKFFLGNGLTTTDHVKAANDLLGRDHKKIVKILKRHINGQQCRGQLGAYFVPPMFFGIPEVIRPEQYDEKANPGKFLHSDFVYN